LKILAFTYIIKLLQATSAKACVFFHIRQQDLLWMKNEQFSMLIQRYSGRTGKDPVLAVQMTEKSLCKHLKNYFKIS